MYTQRSSSVIANVGYSRTAKTLTIQFVSGAIYRYAGVSRRRRDALVQADSVGRYFATRIRPRFTGVRVA